MKIVCRKYFHVFGSILKMLFSYIFFTFSQRFSQHPNKFYYRKFQNHSQIPIHRTNHSQIPITCNHQQQPTTTKIYTHHRNNTTHHRNSNSTHSSKLRQSKATTDGKQAKPTTTQQENYQNTTIHHHNKKKNQNHTEIKIAHRERSVRGFPAKSKALGRRSVGRRL